MISANTALHYLVRDGDVFAVGRRRYLVAAVDADSLETLIVAASSTDDDDDGDPDTGIEDFPQDEPNQDREPSLAASTPAGRLASTTAIGRATALRTREARCRLAGQKRAIKCTCLAPPMRMSRP